MKIDQPDHSDDTLRSRREFLRNSIYAAYATPLITALLVAEESAAGSANNGQCSPKWCENKGLDFPCCTD